jgi:hypothetical protein
MGQRECGANPRRLDDGLTAQLFEASLKVSSGASLPLGSRRTAANCRQFVNLLDNIEVPAAGPDRFCHSGSVNQGGNGVASPAAGVDFDRSRLSQGELIAGIAGLVLLIDLWFSWYGVKVSGAGGVLKGFSIGVSANAWESFGLIDLILFVVAIACIGVAVMRALGRLPDLPYPPATIIAIAGGIALLLILFRTISPPVDTGGVTGIDVTRKIGLWIGLLSAAAITYGGWRAMQESGASFSDLGGGARPAGGTPAADPTGPTTAMPASEPPAGATPPAPAPDPVPGSTGPTTPPGLAGEPPASGGTTPPGI